MPVPLTFEEFQQTCEARPDSLAYADGVYILGPFPQAGDDNMGMRWRLTLHGVIFRSDVLPDLERHLYEFWGEQHYGYVFDPAALSRYSPMDDDVSEQPRKPLRGMRRLKPLPLPG